MDWINVKDNIPAFDVDVLVAYRLGDRMAFDVAYVEQLTTTKNSIIIRWEAGWEIGTPDVIYWMPIPELPETEK